jgi:hypothetical protein
MGLDMNSNYTKKEWEKVIHRRKCALQKVAERLGKEHPLTQMMGAMAWGRNEAEPGPNHTLRKAIYEAAFLEGSYSVLNTWARDNDVPAQNVLIKIWHEE